MKLFSVSVGLFCDCAFVYVCVVLCLLFHMLLNMSLEADIWPSGSILAKEPSCHISGLCSSPGSFPCWCALQVQPVMTQATVFLPSVWKTAWRCLVLELVSAQPRLSGYQWVFVERTSEWELALTLAHSDSLFQKETKENLI